MSKEYFYPVRNPDNPYQVEKVPISEEVYKAIYPDIWKTLQRMQRSGQCNCPKSMLWKCDADCTICPYRASGRFVSLDTPVDDTEGLTIEDTIASDVLSPEAIALDNALLEALYEELDRLDPNGRRICELIMQGKTEREIASDMGKRQSTINYQKNKAFSILHEALKDFI